MARRVDPERAAGGDGPPAFGEAGRHLAGDLLAVAGARTRPDHRDGPQRRQPQVRAAAHPQQDRRAVAEVVELGGPLATARHDEPATDLLEAGEVLLHAILGRAITGQPRAIAGQLRLPGTGQDPVDDPERPVPTQLGGKAHVARLGQAANRTRAATSSAGYLRAVSRTHAAHAVPGSRHASAMPTSDRVGRPWPARSATVHATRSTRS